MCDQKSARYEPSTSDSLIAGSRDFTSKSETVKLHVNSCVVNPVLFVKGYPQKKGVNSSYCYHCQRIKCVKGFSCVDHYEFCKSCQKCPNCCSRSTCRGQIAPVLGELGSPRGQSQGSNTEGYTLPSGSDPT